MNQKTPPNPTLISPRHFQLQIMSGKEVVYEHDSVDFTVESYDLNEYPHKISAVGNLFPKETTTCHNIVGARFEHYDSKTRTVTIRFDHPERPGVWLELKFTMDELNHFTTVDDEKSSSDSYILEEVSSSSGSKSSSLSDEALWNSLKIN